jgi:hypothetical protein
LEKKVLLDYLEKKEFLVLGESLEKKVTKVLKDLLVTKD